MTALPPTLGPSARARHAAWRSLQSDERVDEAAAAVVAHFEGQGGRLAIDSAAAAAVLAKHMRVHLDRLRAALQWSEPIDGEAPYVARTPDGACFLPSAGFAGYLGTLGAVGVREGARIRKRAVRRFAEIDRDGAAPYRLWTGVEGRTPPFLEYLGEVILADELHALFAPAVLDSPAVTLHALAAFRRLRYADAQLRKQRRGELRLLRPNGVTVGVFRLHPGSVESEVREGIGLLQRSIEAERVWRVLARRVAAHRDDDSLTFEGGFEGLRESSGISSSRRQWVRLIVEALRAFVGDGTLAAPITDYKLHAHGVGKGRLVVDVGACLRPSFANTLPRGRGRRLLPVLAPPAAAGVPRDRTSALYTLQWKVLEAMHELARRGDSNPGTLRLTTALVARLAAGAGLSADQTRGVLAKAPWVELRDDRITLADSAALRLLADAARLYASQRAGGRKFSLARRRKPLRRPASLRPAQTVKQPRSK